MKVIFTKNLNGFAKTGEVKEVREGYATNYLIPKGFAEIATTQVLAKVERALQSADKRKQKELEKLSQLKAELETKSFTIKVKVGEKGQVFGGVHEKDILDAVNKKTVSKLSKNQIDLEHPIKEIGTHTIKLKLGQGIEAKANLEIQAE